MNTKPGPYPYQHSGMYPERIAIAQDLNTLLVLCSDLVPQTTNAAQSVESAKYVLHRNYSGDQQAIQ